MEAVINRHLEGLLVNELLLIRVLNVNPITAAIVVQMKNPTQSDYKSPGGSSRTPPIDLLIRSLVRRWEIQCCTQTHQKLILNIKMDYKKLKDHGRRGKHLEGN